MTTNKIIKDGDIIARTTIPDRVVFVKEQTLFTRKINNGIERPLEIDGFDIIVGNIYENPDILETSSKYKSNG